MSGTPDASPISPSEDDTILLADRKTSDTSQSTLDAAVAVSVLAPVAPRKDARLYAIFAALAFALFLPPLELVRSSEGCRGRKL